MNGGRECDGCYIQSGEHPYFSDEIGTDIHSEVECMVATLDASKASVPVLSLGWLEDDLGMEGLSAAGEEETLASRDSIATPT